MRAFLQSMLAFFTLGMGTVACNKAEVQTPPAAPTDVTLVVPGMF
jgi:hypothetical protein